MNCICFRSVGGLLLLSSQHCYVVEDNEGICGYVVATPDVKQYQKRWHSEWLPLMKAKYPKPKNTKKKYLTPAEVRYWILLDYSETFCSFIIQFLVIFGHKSATLHL